MTLHFSSLADLVALDDDPAAPLPHSSVAVLEGGNCELHQGGATHRGVLDSCFMREYLIGGVFHWEIISWVNIFTMGTRIEVIFVREFLEMRANGSNCFPD